MGSAQYKYYGVVISSIWWEQRRLTKLRTFDLNLEGEAGAQSHMI